MMIWNTPPTLPELQAMQDVGLAKTIGIRFTEIGADYLRATLRVTAEILQPYRILHGGASVALAETLGSTAAILCVDRQRYTCVGQEINANHLRQGPLNALLTGTARAFHVGARSHVWGIEIRDERQKLICVSRITMAILDLTAQPQ